jgi:hypothetical protein
LNALLLQQNVGERRNPPNERGLWPDAFNGLVFEDIPFNGPPDPIRDSEFNIRASVKRVVTFLNIRGIESFDQWHPSVFLDAPAPRVQVQQGGQQPLGQRVNIARQPADTYGSMVIFDPSDPFSYAYGGS